MCLTKKPIILLLISIIITKITAQNLCDLEDPTKRCECYFDGQHVSAQCLRTELDQLPNTKDIPKDLEALDVSHNNIQLLQFDDPTYANKLMRTFRAAYNRIDVLPNKFLINGLPHLTTLDLSHNQITQIEAGALDIASLHYLDLSFNQIHALSIGVFAQTRVLRYLDLSYNNLDQLMGYKSLNSSGLGFNDNMQTLKLNSVNLSTISNIFFEKLALTTLSLADNSLEDVPVLPSTLVNLDLSGNHFISIAPRHLVYPQLKYLQLNRLKSLETIENYAFYNLISLEELEIEHCGKLKQFNDKAFGVILDKEQWNLTRLSLNGNGIRKLNETYFQLFNQLDQVDLSSNPWICDCGVIWFKLITQKFNNRDNMRCVAPKRLRNKEVMDLNDDTLPKCNIQSSIRVQKILTSVICILVVILLAIIMYLIYLAPFKESQPSRFIGEESPYSTIVVRDDTY